MFNETAVCLSFTLEYPEKRLGPSSEYSSKMVGGQVRYFFCKVQVNPAFVTDKEAFLFNVR